MTNLLTAIALVITALGTLLTAWGTIRNRTAIKETISAVGQVHTLVNARSERQEDRIEQLTKVIQKSPYVEVPDTIPRKEEEVADDRDQEQDV